MRLVSVGQVATANFLGTRELAARLDLLDKGELLKIV